MTDKEISLREWNDYIENLYDWVQEKYELFEKDIIDQNQYNEHLQYYMKEKERIEKIIESIEGTEDVPSGTNSKTNENLNQSAFENFFGVKLEDQLREIDEEVDEKEPPKMPTEAAEFINEPAKQNEEVWKYVNVTESEGFQSDMVDVTKPNEIEIRILLIGDSAVGRTSLRRAWMGKHFVESHLTTIGASIEEKVMEIDGIKYKVKLTDLGGQDFYSGLRRNFYRNVDGAILVFDLTRPDTFRRLDFWIKEMYRELKTLVPFILVGNKKDDKSRKIDEKMGVRASAQFSRTTLPKFRVSYMETSAKTGVNVQEIFEKICLEVRDLKVREIQN